jgi:hypothetical protein
MLRAARLTEICRVPSSKRCTTKRGKRHTTVRYAINAVSCGPNCPSTSVGTGARVVSPQAGQTRVRH